jgi:hypothetical protein|tara:strand:+ start:214 stop:399 length:186 start_codon:yes stop_codon:yes gene_type:complete
VKTKEKMKMMALDQLKDNHLGVLGTKERAQYEFDLKVNILVDMINLTLCNIRKHTLLIGYL